jgi:hypothetical protein
MKTENRNPALCRSFVAKARNVLSGAPNIIHTWSIDEDEDHCILDIPKQSDDGFDISIEVYPNEVVVSAEAPHVHFELKDDIEDLVDSVLGLTRDLLSPVMRVGEQRSNGKPYRWHLESFRHAQWNTEETMGLFFYSWLGSKSEKIYANKTMPARKPANKPLQPTGLDGG